jgi:hypothetical protein
MKFKAGDKVRIVGHKDWCMWNESWLQYIGKEGIVKSSPRPSNNIYVSFSDGIKGFMPRSLELLDPQMMFDFMYEND